MRRTVYQIYFARIVGRKEVKIGITTADLHSRMEIDISRRRHGGFRILAAIPTFNKEDERVIHWFARKHRLYGEWFKVIPDTIITAWLTKRVAIRRAYRKARREGWRMVHLPRKTI